MVFMLPMPLDLVHTIGGSLSDEKFGGAPKFRRRLPLSMLNSRLGEGFASDLRRYNDFFGLAVDSSCNGLLGFNGLAVDLYATVLVDRCRYGAVRVNDEFGVFARCAGAWTMVSPDFPMVGNVTWFIS